MKVTAFLSYQLPFDIQMLDGDALEDIAFNESGCDFLIHPPSFEEDKIHAGSRQDPSTGGIREGYYLANLASLEITNEIEESLLDGPEAADLFESLGKEMLLRFLRICRTAARQAHILQPSVGRLRYSSVGKEASGLGRWNSQGIDVRLAYAAKQILRKENWQKVKLDLQSGVEPTLWDELILDARSMITIPRRCVLEAAIAAELRIKEFVRTQGVTRDPSYDFLRTRTTVTQFLDVVLPRLGFDLETQDLATYRGVIHLFRARNSVAHKGICTYKSLIDRREVAVNRIEARSLVEHAERLIAALDNATP
jgi:hypothetical protein